MDAPLRAMGDRVPSQLANELGLPEFNCQVVLSAMALYPQQRIPQCAGAGGSAAALPAVKP